MKKIIVVVITILVVLGIYLLYKDEKIYYVDIGDNLISDRSYANYLVHYLNNNLEKYDFSFQNNKCQTTDLINAFLYNQKQNNKTIKNLLIKADILTISIGNNELNRRTLDQTYIDEIINDIDILLDLIKTWCRGKIFLIGLNHEYASAKLKVLAQKHNINYIDIYNYSSLYKDEDKINLLGQEYISKEIIDNL